MVQMFSVADLYKSNTANKRGWNNTPPPFICDRLKRLITELLYPLQSAYGKTIIITSGYRSEQLNKAVGGVQNSQHLQGYAVDIVGSTTEDTKRLYALAKMLDAQGKISVDQCINESGGRWVHISHVSKQTDRHQFF